MGIDDANMGCVYRKQPAKPTLGLRRSKQGNMVYVPVPQSDGYVRQGKAGKTLVLKDKQQKTKTYCGIYTRYGMYDEPSFSSFF